MSGRDDGGPAFPINDMQRVHEVAMAASISIADSQERERAYIIARGAAVGGMTLRDYFIAHAPTEPQPWFQPAMPTERPQLPKFPKKYTGDQRQGDYVREYGEVMKPEDIKSPELRQYAEETRAARRAIAEWDVQAQKQFYVQWPAAWADAMLKARLV